jgi:DNA-binding response OmpR family regulator
MEEAPRILVVEPSKTNLGVMARRLWEASYRVATAESGRSAVAELYRAPVDLVLAELNMERMDGAELTRLIRDEVQWRDVPVILITGRSEPTAMVRAFEAGADDVLVKPFHFEVLFARIDRFIARARSLEQLRQDNQSLDARIVERAISLGEMTDRLVASETERRRLQRAVATAGR